MKICGPAKIQCCHDADGFIFRNIHLKICDCLPSCESISYSALSSQASFDLTGPLFGMAIEPSDESHRLGIEKYLDLNACYFSNLLTNFTFSATYSRLIVSFNDEHFIPTTRMASSNYIDFLASAGGLFGLFMGASLLSIVELLYYFTVRIFFTYHKDHPITVGNRVPTIPFTTQRRAPPHTIQKQSYVFTYLP